MATDHNQGRRGHFHRGRRGPDRRGPERRQGPPPDQGNRPERSDRLDVEQIMREIRARISQPLSIPGVSSPSCSSSFAAVRGSGL